MVWRENEFYQLYRIVYNDNPAGGLLHIILDDGNTEDRHLDWNENYIKTEESENSMAATCLSMIEILRPLTEQQRDNLIYRAYCNYVGREP